MIESFVGDRLANLRIAKGVSAREMSLAIGQSENYINKIENKKSYPSMTAFFYICEYLGITPRDFFDDGNINPQQLNNIVEGLKRLDGGALVHIAGIVGEMESKN